MSFDYHRDSHAASLAQPAPDDATESGPAWREHIVTIIAAAIAVLIVASVAVLMGIA